MGKESKNIYITFGNGSRNITMRSTMKTKEGYVLVDGMVVPKENVIKVEKR